MTGPIKTAMGNTAYELISFESLLTEHSPQFDAAFVSRDVTSTSTKHELTAHTQVRYELLLRAVGLRWVHIHSAGADRPVYQQLLARNVNITTSSGANAKVVAQSAVGGLLALARHLPQLFKAQQSHLWSPRLESNLPIDLQDQTALIVGWGPIGQTIAKTLSALGIKAIAVTTQTPANLQTQTVCFEEIYSALPKVNWLILACPLTKKTNRLVDAFFLSALPKGAGIVNVARGEVIVQDALIAALRSGHIGSAYLDVFEHEPLEAESPLWDFANVIVSPHSAGHSDGNEKRVEQLFLDNLRNRLQSWVN